MEALLESNGASKAKSGGFAKQADGTKNLRKREQYLEEMSEEQRKVAEAYMGDKLEKWRSTLESETLETVYTVVTLQINEGPSGEN